jgi:hypothetical protein
MAQGDFTSCIIEIDKDGDYKCSLERKGIWLSAYGKTNIEAFDKMCDLITDMDNEVIKIQFEDE